MALIGKARGFEGSRGPRASRPEGLGDRLRQKRCIHIGTECFIAVRGVSRKRADKSSAGFHPLAAARRRAFNRGPRQARGLLASPVSSPARTITATLTTR
jgi:hypothetical protein